MESKYNKIMKLDCHESPNNIMCVSIIHSKPLEIKIACGTYQAILIWTYKIIKEYNSLIILLFLIKKRLKRLKKQKIMLTVKKFCSFRESLGDFTLDLKLNDLMGGWVRCIIPINYASNKTIIATAGEEGKIKLWNLKSGELIDSLKGHAKPVTCMSNLIYDKEKTTIVTASDDKTIKIWSVAPKRQCIKTMIGHTANIFALITLKNMINKHYIITGGADKTIRVWNCETGFFTKTMNENETILCIARLNKIKNNTLILCSCTDNTINTWCVENGLKINFYVIEYYSITCMWRYENNKDEFLCGTEEGNIIILSHNEKKIVNVEEGHNDRINGIIGLNKLFDNSGYLIATGSNDKQYILWMINK